VSSGSGILVVASGGLGDAVLLAHVFPRFAALARPDERIVLVVRRDARKMAFLFDGLADVEAVDYDKYARSFSLKAFFHRRAVHKHLGARPWRLIVNTDYLRHPRRDERLIKSLAADEKLAMRARSWAKYDTELARNESIYARLFDSGPALLDKVVRWRRFADWLTGKAEPVPILRFAPDRLPEPAPTQKPLAILIPFSAVREKQANADVFAEIARKLPDSYDILIAGAPDDLDRNPDYAPLLDLPRVRFEACDFFGLAKLMRAAKIVVSVDTASMHLAVAMGAPTLCLASAAYVGEIVPYAAEIAPTNVRFVYTPMACQGCLGVCTLPKEAGRFPCVARLSRTDIMSEIVNMTADTNAA
jgi:ADP-heptose:LPS heptosyltransferase